MSNRKIELIRTVEKWQERDFQLRDYCYEWLFDLFLIAVVEEDNLSWTEIFRKEEKFLS